MIRRIQRPWPRPACGGDPIWWKECHVERAGTMARALRAVAFLGAVALLGFTTCKLAAPAFIETLEQGFFQAAENGTAHQILSVYERAVASVVSAVALIAVAGAASVGLSGEREEDTWVSLIATPLTPLEIVRGKMIGAVWSARWVGLVWLALVLTGVALGAVHPVGFVICLAFNVVELWFAAALGTVFSLRSRNSARSAVATVAALIVLNGGYLLLFLPFRFNSPIPLLGVTPFINGISLMGYPDVRSLLEGNFIRPNFGLFPFEVELIITALLSMAAHVTAAAALTYYLVVNFDDTIDRPRTFGGRAPRWAGREIVFEDETEPDEVGSVNP